MATDRGTIRALTGDDLPMVLAWRNHPSIRSMMFDSRTIEPEEHRAWFDATSRNPARRLLIVESGEATLGFVQFDGVEPGGVADWGFYARPEAPRGTGRLLGRVALDHGFDVLHLHKVCGRIIAANEASIGLHRRLGFRQEGTLREQHRIDDVWYSVLCFGLLRREWRNARAALVLDPQPQSGKLET